MKRILLAFATILAPLPLLALPNYDPFADATGSGGTAYAVGNWVSKNDSGTIPTNPNPGQKDATGAGWFHAGAAANNSPTIESGNVQYPGLAGGSGSKVLVGNGTATDLATGRYVPPGMDLAMSAAGFRYYSFVLKASDLSALSTAGTAAIWIAGFNNSTATSQTGVPTVIGARTILQAVTDGFQIGLCKAGTDAPVIDASQTFTTTSNIFIVVSYEVKTGGTTDDEVSMWINPSHTTFGNNANRPAATLITGPGFNDLATVPTSAIRSFLLGNKASIGLHHVDEVRVAADWAGVTPALISTQPTNVTKDHGQTAVFNVGTGSAATYQWQKNGMDLGGETAASLTLPNVSQSDENNYAVVVTGGHGSITSSIVTLTVNDPKVASGPSPSSQSLPPGATAVFSTTAIGTPTLTHQWKKDGSDVVNGTFGGTTISGATTTTLTIAGVRAGGGGDSGAYTLSVTNGNGRGTTSSAATLSVINPAVTTDPQSQTKNYNESVTFSATAAGSSPPFSYVWQKNGSDVTVDGIRIVQTNSGTTSTLTIHNLTFADQALTPGYTVVVTDNASQAASSFAATLTVVDPLNTTPVSNVITNAGSIAKLRVQAAGSGTVTYVWKTNDVVVADGATGWGSTISGATTDTLTIANVTASDANTYVVEVSGAGPTQNSTGALSVVTITRQPTPASLVIATGTRAVFSAAASVAGSGTLSYQWRKTSGNIAGETSTAIAITNAQPGDSDAYVLRVTYGPGSEFVDSSSAALTVSSSPLQLHRANVVVARVGDGLQLLRDAGNSIYLDQFTTSGSYVNTVTIPETGTNAIIARGSVGDTIGGLNGMTTLTTTEDGTRLVLNGYRTEYDPSATLILGSAADTATPRAVATVGHLSEYAVVMQGLPASMGANNYRCAAFDGVDEFWGATSAGTGVYYFGTQVAEGRAGSIANLRIVSLFNGKLYYCGANNGVYHFEGKPHPGDVETQDIAVVTTGGSGACEFAVSPDGNTIYLADGRNYSDASPVLTIGGVQKWVSVGGSFGTDPVAILRPDPGTNVGALYVTVDFSGANPVIYATTVGAPVGSPNKLVRIVDDGSNSGAGTSTVLATAGPNQQFRGIRFGPSLPAPVLSPTLPGAGTTSVTVSWSSVSGVVYRLDYKDDVGAIGWTALSTNTASGSTTSFIDPTSPAPAKRFYRAVANP